MASIIVAFPKAEDAKNIRNIIVRNGYQVAAVCVSGAQVLQAADNLGEGMVICSYRFRDMQYDHLKECLPRDFEMLLIASEGILDTCVTPDIVRLCLPLKVHDLMDTIEFMQSAIIRRQKKKKTAACMSWIKAFARRNTRHRFAAVSHCENVFRSKSSLLFP